VADVYVEPRSEVSFGDIFAVEFLHDVHLRADAVLMGTRDIPAKHGGGLAYGPGYARNREFVLAHGAPYRSVLVTDNCVIDTNLSQGRGKGRPTGRLLFAPVIAADDDAMTTRSFGRFPLPAGGPNLPQAVVELRRCYMVDSRDVADHVSRRVASLGDEVAEDLEVRWNAFAARRGPLASARQSEKLCGLLARARGDEAPNEVELAIGRAVAEAFATAWRVEGNALEAVGAAFDDEAEGAAELDELRVQLRALAQDATRAAEALEGGLAADGVSPS
jgi:hypothetical protein